MNYYWHDHTAMNGAPTLEGLAATIELFEATQLNWPSDLNEGSLIIVHAGEDEGNTRDEWAEVADLDSGKFVVLVSSAGVGNSYENSAIYCVHVAFEVIADKIEANGVGSFKSQIENGAPDWSLFEPKPYPEHLVSRYLVDLAIAASDNDDFKDKLVAIAPAIDASAKKEFSECGGEDSDWDDPNCRLRKTREILGQISQTGKGE